MGEGVGARKHQAKLTGSFSEAWYFIGDVRILFDGGDGVVEGIGRTCWFGRMLWVGRWCCSWDGSNGRRVGGAEAVFFEGRIGWHRRWGRCGDGRLWVRRQNFIWDAKPWDFCRRSGWCGRGGRILAVANSAMLLRGYTMFWG